jgi:hypothetical protein
MGDVALQGMAPPRSRNPKIDLLPMFPVSSVTHVPA